MVSTIRDGVDAFKRIQELSICQIGKKEKEANPWKYHPQGFAITKDRYFMSFNNENQGVIYQYDRYNPTWYLKYDKLGAPGFGHPGCIQAADNILIVPSQTSSFTGADIALYDTNNLEAGGIRLPTEGERIGSAGIALYEVNGNVRKYFILTNYKSWWLTVKDGNLKEATISSSIYAEYAEGGLDNGQSENVYVDRNGDIFVIVAAQDNSGKNLIQLQKFDISSNPYKRKVVATKEIGSGSWANCAAAVGIEIIDDSIKMYVTNKPGLSQRDIYINQSVCFGPSIQRDSGGINGIAPLEMIAFDYEHSGKQDYILARLKDGHVKIFKHGEGDHFETVYEDDAQGIGGYGLLTPNDQILAFDYDKTNKLDHIVIYRPGDRRVWILRHNNNWFEPVFQSENGIGEYDLRAYGDRAFVYDYDSSGKLDHLVFYRPGGQRIMILKHDGSNFSVVYNRNDLGGYDLKSELDTGFAFDYNNSGKRDHIAFYRPGSKTMWIMKRQGSGFSPVYRENRNGIGEFDLYATGDRALAFDLFSNGQMSSMILYRPGTDVLWVIGKNYDGSRPFRPYIRCHQIPYHKISLGDKVIAFDFNHIGRFDHWIVYNPDNGKFWVYHKYT